MGVRRFEELSGFPWNMDVNGLYSTDLKLEVSIPLSLDY